MMTPQTVQQLLQVFRLFHENYGRGTPLHRAYHKAVRSVALSHSVTYQTIGDGCRRRLRLGDINDLFELLSAWIRGDPRGLARQLKENSDPAAHAEIDRFFADGTATTPPNQKASVKSMANEEFETISFRLRGSDARMLRALAELKGVSAGVLTEKLISESVRQQIKVVAKGIIEE